jgi:uridylate kinase
MENKKLFIISLGGSIVIPAPGEIDVIFLKKFKKLILSFIKKGYKFAIVTGGGKICRVYQKAAKELADVSFDDLYWIGISTTKLNALLLKTTFRKDVYPEVVDNPTKKIDMSKNKIVFAAGWKPGWSTDMIAVLLAKNLRAESIINLSNISFVYDKDFNLYKDAKPIKDISWNDYLKLSGSKWIPGLSKPFDPIAAKLAKKLNKSVVVAKGTNLKNLENILKGKKFSGTTISN